MTSTPPTASSSDARWTTSTTLADLADWLRACRRIVVVTHVKPDGDAVGSTIGVVRALNASSPFGLRAEAWFAGPMPPWLQEVVGQTPHKILDKDGPPAHADPEAVLIIDTGSWMQLEPYADWLKKRHDTCAIIDHHVNGDADVAPLRVIETTAAAVCQPAAELCRLLLGVASATQLPKDVATALFLGLATDTGWFRHSNVDRRVMSLAGELIDAGADNVRLYAVTEQQDTPGRLRLLSRALATLELHDQNRIATMELRQRDFAETGAQPGESGGFVDVSQGLASVQVTVLLTEASPAEFGSPSRGPLTKLSLRSKAIAPRGFDPVDVNAVASELGGGGHVRAAGARVPLDMAEAKAKVVEAIKRRTKRP